MALLAALAAPAWATSVSAQAPRTAARHITTILSLPQTAQEYHAIFGSARPGVIARTTSRVSDFVDDVLGRGPATAAASSAGTVLRQVNAERGAVLLLVGHNVGGAFRALDGSAVALEQLAAAAERNDNLLIAVTCEASLYVRADGGVGVTRVIQVPEALDVTRVVREYVAGRTFLGIPPFSAAPYPGERLEAALAGTTVAGMRVSRVLARAEATAHGRYVFRTYGPATGVVLGGGGLLRISGE
jgi:hypothetical protein